MSDEPMGDVDLLAGLIYALAGSRSDGVAVRGPMRDHHEKWTAKAQMIDRDGEPVGEDGIVATVKIASAGDRLPPTHAQCHRALLREAYEDAVRHRALLDGAIAAAGAVLTAEGGE